MADMSPGAMKDRFKGGADISTMRGGKRQWDTGTGADTVNAESRSVKAGSVKSAARFNNSGQKASAASIDSTKGMTVGRSVTAGPSYPGQTGGNGPKVAVPKGPTKTLQMGRTGGTDKSPAKGQKTGAGRFQGKMRGK